jgi:hypothetical protein
VADLMAFLPVCTDTKLKDNHVYMSVEVLFSWMIFKGLSKISYRGNKIRLQVLYLLYKAPDNSCFRKNIKKSV